MRESSRFELWYGRDEPPVERQELRAGALVAELERADLRYVYLGDVELVRRMHAAVRDPNWGTIPPVLSNFGLEQSEDSFRITFDARHQAGDIDFCWQGQIVGSADGTLEYAMDGRAEFDFRYNRIGLCLLHPAQNAGRRFRARTPEGEIEDLLPETIGVQRIVNGLPAPIFPSFEQLEIEVADGLWARFELHGDLFEMEDQRNWTDASFKTYSTPLQLGFPHQARRGQKIRQVVRVTVKGATDRPRSARDASVRISLDQPVGRLPALGLGTASHGGDLSPRETDLLRTLQLDHLRADVRLGHERWRQELMRAAAQAREIEAALELAVHLGDGEKGGLDELAELLRDAGVEVARVLVFREGESSTAGRWVSLARERLLAAAPGALFAGGTNVLFTDLNRFRPEIGAMDAVVYPLNATVHADDDKSVVETMATQSETVRSARAFCGALPIGVSPVTFNRRFNPVATGVEPEASPGELPPQVDPRQCSLLGAGWTVGSVKYLAEAGAAFVTYYETTGWRGVMETEAGSALSKRFPSRPGMVYPLYHVLADVGEWKGAEVVDARSNEPLAVEALAVRQDDRVRLLVANLTPSIQRCTIGTLGAERVSLRRLDETTARLALDRPEEFRRQSEQASAAGGELALELSPFAVVRVAA